MNGISRVVFGAALLVLLGACGKENATAGAPVAGQVTKTVTASASAKPASAKPATSPRKPPGIAKCGSAHTDAVVAPGEAPSEQIWDTAIVVTNRGSAPCTLEGVSKLELYTGGDGKPLGIKEVTMDGQPPELVTLMPGEQATMAMLIHTAPKPVPADCLEGGSFAEVTLPGDAKAIEAWLPDRAWMPVVCGAVEVSPWGKGGAPGVR
jgi:hypothetical protein